MAVCAAHAAVDVEPVPSQLPICVSSPIAVSYTNLRSGIYVYCRAHRTLGIACLKASGACMERLVGYSLQCMALSLATHCARSLPWMWGAVYAYCSAELGLEEGPFYQDNFALARRCVRANENVLRVMTSWSACFL